jgi:hypothetical protein
LPSLYSQALVAKHWRLLLKCVEPFLPTADFITKGIVVRELPRRPFAESYQRRIDSIVRLIERIRKVQ